MISNSKLQKAICNCILRRLQTYPEFLEWLHWPPAARYSHGLQFYKHRWIVLRCVWRPLCLSLPHVHRAALHPQSDHREFIFARTVMHSKQVCAGNQDWSSRYAAFLSPEFWKLWFMWAPRGRRGNEKCQTSFTVCWSRPDTSTGGNQQPWQKCWTHIKVWMLCFCPLNKNDLHEEAR